MCKKNKNYLLVAAGILALCPFSMASADTINGTGGAWQAASSWTQSQLADGTSPTPGTPYWNNESGDGPKGNIGWCLTGGGSTCTMIGSPGTTLPYFGSASGASVSNMFFTSSGVPLTLTLDGINTNEKVADAFDIFGYYIITGGTPGALVPLFSTQPGGSQSSVGSTAFLSLTAGTNYGFYIENVKGRQTGPESDYIFEMSGQNTELTLGPDNLQHFAVFQTSSGYLIGDQDGVGCTTNVACVNPIDFDYNNLIVSANPIPEPATIGLIAISSLLLGGLLRQKLLRRD